MSNQAGNYGETGKFSTSIVRKLSSRLFFRALGLFLSLDILLCLLISACLLIYGEGRAGEAARQLAAGAAPAVAQANTEGVEVRLYRGEPPGIRVIAPFSSLLPAPISESRRSLDLPGPAGDSWFQRLDNLAYLVFFQQGESTYQIAVPLGVFCRFFRYAAIILLIYQLLTLLSGISKNQSLARELLAPISQLAEAAHSLNRAGSQFDPDKMAALAGKLENINAARLDTRIQVDETQEELRNLAQAINGMLDRINAAYRAQVRFVSDASHELRTPISVIQGYANLLDRWGKNDQKTLQESITAIKDEAANMKDLVEQLLFLARGDNNTIRLQPEAIDLALLAQEVVNETQLIDSGHDFQVRAQPLLIQADRALLKQALRILVDNAIKYTDPGGHIRVEARLDQAWARISVIDDGIGISPEIVPQIFDRFYRADESRARATGGAGLGLSIAKWIATRHGGHLEVLSRAGIGTQVMLALPAPAANPPSLTNPLESAGQSE